MSSGNDDASSNVGNQFIPAGDASLLMAQMLQTMQQTQSDLHAQMRDVLRNQVNHRNEVVGDVFTRRVKDFIALGGMKFSGNQDYMEAERWVQECGALFERMNLTPVQRAEIAAHQLVGSTLSWWQSIKTEIDLTKFTWVQFQERFVNQFIPMTVKSQLAEKFLRLKQGGYSVRQYINKFNELSRFAPNIIDTDRRKNDKFIRGLNAHIAKGVLSVQFQSFDTVLNMALSVEEYEGSGLVERNCHTGQLSNQQVRHHDKWNHRATPYGRDFAYSRNGFRTHDQQGHMQQGRGQLGRPRALFFPAPPVLAAVPAVRTLGQRNRDACWGCGQPGHKLVDCPSRV